MQDWFVGLSIFQLTRKLFQATDFSRLTAPFCEDRAHNKISFFLARALSRTLSLAISVSREAAAALARKAPPKITRGIRKTGGKTCLPQQGSYISLNPTPYTLHPKPDLRQQQRA